MPSTFGRRPQLTNPFLDIMISQSQKSLMGKIVDNIKQEVEQDRELKQNLDKFREERRILEESEALTKARSKIHTYY